MTAEVDIDLNLPENFEVGERIPNEASYALEEMDWKIDWIKKSHETSFYGD